MKNLPKLKKPKRPDLSARSVRLPFKRAIPTEERMTDALSNVPRITNDTISDHREEVLKSARKYIYPLQHSKHRVVRISLALLVTVVVAFFAYCGLSLYKFQSTSGFIYAVTQVVPFPIAKAGNSWISYESYLFELRRNMHYYETQQQTDFSSKDGKTQLKRLKQQTMAQVTEDAFIKQLAAKNGVGVTGQDVDNQLALVRSENRLGNSDRVFKEVLNEFWGWNEGDFKRELRQQLLQQAVVAKLDTPSAARAQAALKQLQGGTDFAAVATQASDDAATKPTGGAYAETITANDRDVPPAITQALFKLKPGQISDIVNTGYTLEILKVIDKTGTSIHASHIQFSLQPITTFTKPLETKNPPKTYVKP
ncbi:MAG: Peptidylprolyl isomerase [Candidatus Saccharibacteria bacterium]|nr:Peptidylprolyl isomerase [Candidatus Saccharibacteria bacterium]